MQDGLRDRLVASLPAYAALASRVGPLLNLRDRLPGLAALSEMMLGLSARRSLPQWQGRHFFNTPHTGATRDEVLAGAKRWGRDRPPGKGWELEDKLAAHVATFPRDPTTRAVFAEDSAAMIGLAIALVCIALHQVTGNPMWDALGSILVGLLLAVVAVILIDRNRRFLTGEPASSQIYAAVVQRLAELPDVQTVRFLRLEWIGPKQLFLAGSVDLVGDDTESAVAHRLRRLERQLEAEPLIADALLTVSDPDFEDE